MHATFYPVFCDFVIVLRFTSATLFATLLTVVKSQCDLSVLAVSLMGFQNKKIDRVELYPIFLIFFEFF